MNDVLSSWFGLSAEVSIRWGLTLLHFLWQGTLIGLLALLAAKLLRNQSAGVRYMLHAVALLACPLCVALTFALVEIPLAFQVSPQSDSLTMSEPATSVAGSSLDTSDMPYPELKPDVEPAQTRTGALLPSANPTAMSIEASGAAEDFAEARPLPVWLAAIAQWMTVLYTVGAFCFLIRLVIALWGGQRLRAVSNPVSDSALLELIRIQAHRIGLQLVPVVAYCERVAVPTVIGVLRPMILLPATLTTCLTTDELSAILSHELAHIRRYDLWMNLLQRLIESLLFFHPVVWFLSRRLSAEREICCDDLVVRCGHQPMHYAGALLRMAELCAGSTARNSLAIAATTGGPTLLEHRVLRLIQASPVTRLHLNRRGLFLLASTLLLALAIFVPVNWWGSDSSTIEPSNSNSALIVSGSQQSPDNIPKKEGEAPAALATVEEPASTTVTITGRVELEDGTLVTKPGSLHIRSRSNRSSTNLGCNLEAGRFSAKVLAGKMNVAAFVDGYAPAWTDEFELSGGSTKDDLVIVLKTGTKKTIRVVDEDDNPVAGATLVMHPEIHRETTGPVIKLKTDVHGLLTVEHLADTLYGIRVYAPGFQTLRTDRVSISGEEELVHALKRCRPATGLILNSDGTPSAGAAVLKCIEALSTRPNSGASYYSTSSADGGWFGQRIATTNTDGRFELDQLNDDSQYMMVIQGTDGSRLVLSDLGAGQVDREITLPERRDLMITVTGDTSPLPVRDGKPFVVIRQQVTMRTATGHGSSGSLGANVPLELDAMGGSATFQGLIVDPQADQSSAEVEVSLGYGNDLKKIVRIEPEGDTKVTFELPPAKSGTLVSTTSDESPLEPLKLLAILQARDRQFDNRSLKVELTWDELMSPQGEANEERFNAIRFGQPDPGMPEGLPADYQQPHRVQYLWTRRGNEAMVERFADMEKAVEEKYSRMEKHRLDHADVWKYLLPCGIGFADEIASVTSTEVVEDGYIIKGLLKRSSAVIDGRQNSFVMHLDKDLIIRRAELNYHVYDIVVVTSGTHQSSDAPAPAERGDFTKYYLATKGERLGERIGIAEHYAYQVRDVSDPLADQQFDERVRNNPLKVTAQNGMPDLQLPGLPNVKDSLPKAENSGPFVEPDNSIAIEIKYPNCIVNIESLPERPLLDAISNFNLTSQESPTGVLQIPITEQETRDAITKFATEKHVPEAVRVQLEEILKSGTLPSNAYFRRFTRFDDGRQMRGVWWVRLVVETKDGPVYSVPVRSTSLFTRPYTQMERQQNAADGLTLIGRVASYYETPPEPFKSGSTELPVFSVDTPLSRAMLEIRRFSPGWTFQKSVDALIGRTKEALKGNDITGFKALFETTDASETLQEFAVSELQQLGQSQIRSMKVSPVKLQGHLLTWSAWQAFKPNLPVAAFLEIEYEDKDGATRRADAQPLADRSKTLALELGFVGDELRLVNYVSDGEANPPESLNPGPSISGHIEPLADGTHLVTDVITNPGTLLSAHLANEEVRLRDFRQPDQTAAADEGSPEVDSPESDPVVSVNADQQSPPQKPEPPTPITEAQRREIVLKAVEDADRIPDEQARQKAQWDLVSSLVREGLRDEAFQQALKLRTVNPQTCIYSLKTIAEDAVKRGDQATVLKAWDAANQSNKDSGAKYNHYVIELGFKLNRPVAEMLAVAAAAKRNDQQRAYRDIRNELAWRGRVDEAYAISATHLSNLPKDFNDREIAFYCSSARGYDYYLKHDHLGQAIRIIEQMPKGEHRDAAIGHLIDGLLYVVNKDQVTEKNLALAETWGGRIDDKLKQAAARARILERRLPGMSVEPLEQQFSIVTSREEKLAYLRRIFQKLLEENRIEEADKILPREVQLVKEQPRPEQKSKFGNVDDVLVEKMTTWNHHAAIVRALHKAGRTEEAKARLEAMNDLPDSEPVFLVGNLAGIRLQLYKELEDFDAVEKQYAANPNPLSSISLAAWMMNKGQFDRGWTHVASLVDMSPEAMFPPELRSKPMYFLAQPFEILAKELFKVNRPDDALTFLSKLPESRDTAHAFETFGELLVQSGRSAELDQWLAKLPHETARTHARLGALREITKLTENKTQPK